MQAVDWVFGVRVPGGQLAAVLIRPSELVGIMDDTCCADSGTPA